MIEPGSARNLNQRGIVAFYESGSAYGLTEKKIPTEMRNSMHLQVPKTSHMNLEQKSMASEY